MITGKTISQLDVLTNVTDNTLVPVQENNNTYHIAYSSITNNLIEKGFNNGVKLLAKQQINFNDPVISTGNILLTYCNTFPCFAPCIPMPSVGEIISSTGATGTCVGYDTFNMVLSGVTGVFNTGELVTGLTSGCVFFVFDTSIQSLSSQQVSLTGGTKFIIDKVLITNVSQDLTTASGAYLYQFSSSNELSSGTLSPSIFPSTNNFLFMTNSSSYNTSVNDTVYYVQKDAEGVNVTGDLYIYGYIIQ